MADKNLDKVIFDNTFAEVLSGLSTLEKEEKASVEKFFKYFSREFERVVWNHPNMEVVRHFRLLKSYWDRVEAVVKNCEKLLESRKLKQSDKQKRLSRKKREKWESVAALRGFDIREIIDSVPKGG